MPKFKTFAQVLIVPGRHIVSYWGSKLFERTGIKKLFGANLVAAVFVTTMVIPQTDNQLAQVLTNQTNSTPISISTLTETTFELPLIQFALSQFYSGFHPGVDMTAPRGTQVYAIEEGVVETATYSLFGYGQHVVIKHNNGLSSLYAHLSEINVSAGNKVSRGQLVGKVGATGFATGNHLHMEIYYNGTAVNPLEVLPIKTQELRLDGILTKPQTPVAKAS